MIYFHFDFKNVTLEVPKELSDYANSISKNFENIEELENNVAFLEYENLKSIHYFMTQDEDEENELE